MTFSSFTHILQAIVKPVLRSKINQQGVVNVRLFFVMISCSQLL